MFAAFAFMTNKTCLSCFVITGFYREEPMSPYKPIHRNKKASKRSRNQAFCSISQSCIPWCYDSPFFTEIWTWSFIVWLQGQVPELRPLNLPPSAWKNEIGFAKHWTKINSLTSCCSHRVEHHRLHSWSFLGFQKNLSLPSSVTLAELFQPL